MKAHSTFIEFLNNLFLKDPKVDIERLPSIPTNVLEDISNGLYTEKSLKNYISEKKYEFTEPDSQDMVPHKILKRLKLSEEKSVPTIVADDERDVSKSVYHESKKEIIKDRINQEHASFRREPKIKSLEINENEETDVLSKNDCVTQKTDLFDTDSKTKEKDKVLKPKIRLVQGKTGKVLKTSKQKKKTDLKKKIKKKNKIKKKKDESKAVDGNQDTLSRITQELPKYNWLEEKIKNGESSNTSSTPPSNSEITSNLKSDEIVISDGEDCELQNNAQEVLIVNESSVSEVNLQQPDNSPNPLNDHAAENEVVIMEEEMAVDLSITSKNITAEEAEISNELESVEGVNTMEYMVENLMKKIDENKEKHAEFNLNPTVGTPTVDINSTSKPASSLTNSISDSQSGNQKYKNSLTENIEKLKKDLDELKNKKMQELEEIMEIKENKEKAMIELDNVKKDIEKQRAILASFTSYANDQTRRRDSTPSPQAQVTSASYPSRPGLPLQMRPGLPHSQTASMVLPDLINHETHETSAAEAGSHPSQGRMIMPHNGQLYGARHRPGAPGLPLPPSVQVHSVSPHHVQAQMLQRAQQTPTQFQNTNIHHFLPHHDPRHPQYPQHMVPQSSPMPRVQRSSPVTIAPTPISQTQTSNSMPRSIAIPEVRRPSTGSTPDSQVAMIRPKAFCRETSHELQQPSSDVRSQQPPACVTDKRRSEVATRGSTGGHGGHGGPTSQPPSHSRIQPSTSTSNANIPLHARPAYFSKSSLTETGHKEVAGSDSGGPPTRCVVCHSLANFLCSGCQKIYYCTVRCQSFHWSSHMMVCKTLKKQSQPQSLSHQHQVNPHPPPKKHQQQSKQQQVAYNQPTPMNLNCNPALPRQAHSFGQGQSQQPATNMNWGALMMAVQANQMTRNKRLELRNFRK